MKLRNIDKALFTEIMVRIYEVADAKNQTELAEFLELRQATISDAKKRRSIPAEWLLKILVKTQVSPDWIMTGQSAKYLQELDSEKSAVCEKIYPPKECSTDVLLCELVGRALGMLDNGRLQEKPGT